MKCFTFFIIILVCISSSYATNITASDVQNNWANVGNPRDGNSGTWSISGSSIVSPDSGARISDFSMGDGTFSGTFRTSGNDDDIIGFIFGYQDMNNHYRIGWDSYDYNGGYADIGGSHGLRIIKEVGGTNNFIYTNSIRWQRNVNYDFSITRSGANYQVIINKGATNILNYTTNDSQFAIGKVGIYTASQSPVYFSNLQAVIPEAGSLSLFLIAGIVGYTIRKIRKH